jgi:pilus assembly protein CpaE
MPKGEPPVALTSRRAAIISPDATMVQEIQQLLEVRLPGVGVTHSRSYPSPRDAASVLSGGSQVVFLDVASDPEHALELLGALGRLTYGVQVVALLGGNDPDFILHCLRAGAADFMLRPFTEEQLDAALAKLARHQPAAEQLGKEPAKMVAVMPAKGACGATTVAYNLAFQWKKLTGQRVLLADLDPLAGTLSFLLKIKSTYSFLDVLQRAHELDGDLWNAMVTSVGGVDVLLSPELLSDNPQDVRDPAPILDYARHAYDVVILDAGSVYGEWNLNQARAASELLLVTTNELPSLQAAQRALSYLDANRIGRWKVRVVVNRYQRNVGLNRDVIGTALHTDVFESLPSDYEGVQRSLMEGKPVLTTTPLGKGFAQLAARLTGQKKEGKKTGALEGLLGLFSKSPK